LNTTPGEFAGLSLADLQRIWEFFDWEYIALADMHLPDAEYKRRETLLNARKQRLIERMKELEQAGDAYNYDDSPEGMIARYGRQAERDRDWTL
jgi:hypothetical protein